MPIITLLTDFGCGSPYVAQMKGGILGIAPDVNIIDITHDVPPQDVLAGAIVLGDTAMYFPLGTVHVAVVDPGVGTERAIVAALVDGHWFVAPDNGLLTGILATHTPTDVRSLTNEALWRAKVSSTFHGRDIMAPVAAHLSQGVSPADIGPTHGELVRLRWPLPKVADGQLQGEVVNIDSFGNLITNIHRRDVEAWSPAAEVVVLCNGQSIAGISRTYAERPSGSLVALFGSSERLEIATVNGNAADSTGTSLGEPVIIRRSTRDTSIVD